MADYKTAIALSILVGPSAYSSDSAHTSTDTDETDTTDTTDETATTDTTDELGASITQGAATTTNLFADGGRVAGVGSIVATDGTTWFVPANTNYTNSAIPFAPDLYNDYLSYRN